MAARIHGDRGTLVYRKISYRTGFDETMLDPYNGATLDRTFAVEYLLAEGRLMASVVLDHLADHVHAALKAAFSELIRANPGQSFYAFALFTDDSLQFLHAAANTEEALTSTVKRYREMVDPKYGCTSTRAGMRWSYGDWGFFANVGAEHFAEINEALIANIDGPEEELKARIDSLRPQSERLSKTREGRLFRIGSERSKITLLVVGDLPSELVESWVSARQSAGCCRSLHQLEL